MLFIYTICLILTDYNVCTGKSMFAIMMVINELWVTSGGQGCIRYDRGSEFVNVLMSLFGKAFGVKTSPNKRPFNPNASGLVERPNRWVKHFLYNLMLTCGTTNWRILLPIMEMTLAMQWRSNINCSPNEYTFGHNFELIQSEDAVRNYVKAMEAAEKMHLDRTKVSAKAVDTLVRKLELSSDVLQKLKTELSNFSTPLGTDVKRIELEKECGRLGESLTLCKTEYNKLLNELSSGNASDPLKTTGDIANALQNKQKIETELTSVMSKLKSLSEVGGDGSKEGVDEEGEINPFQYNFKEDRFGFVKSIGAATLSYSINAC